MEISCRSSAARGLLGPVHDTSERREGLWHAGLAHERDSASDKCTMTNPIAQRHLRDAPSAPVVHSFSEVPRVAAPERSSSAQPGAATLSLGEHWAWTSVSSTAVPGLYRFCYQ